jgi:AraC-like DNA-binding protein
MWSCWPGPKITFKRAPGQDYWVHRYIAFTGTLVSRWQELGIFPVPPQPLPSIAIVREFDELLKLQTRSDALGRLRAVNLLEKILLTLAEKRPQRTDTWLADLRERLARQATLWPDYNLLAQQIGMSLSTLRRRFRSIAGVPLHTEVMSHRIAAARDLLVDTAMPIKEIASRLGYRDVYFFSRQFRQIAGVSPTLFRISSQKRAILLTDSLDEIDDNDECK